MTVEALAYWHELAPQAIQERTLIPSTALRFARLCRNLALEDAMWLEIETNGLMGDRVQLQMDETGGGLQSVERKAHDLLGKLLTLDAKNDVGLAAFRLAPTGRALASASAEKKLNALEQLNAKRLRAV